MHIGIGDLETLVIKALSTVLDQHDAKRVSDVVLFGELSGKKSHGIVRVPDIVLNTRPSHKPNTTTKTPVSKLIKGNNNPGMLVASIAMDEVIALANKHGFGIVGTLDTFSTSGCLSYYLEKIAINNLIGIIMARSDPYIAPFNSAEPLFGTNPIGFAIPSDPSPFIFDMGTSAISYGEVLRLKCENKKLDKGIALDVKGSPTTDPDQAVDGAVVSFDKSYKGSGLAMIVEILAGLLPGAGFIDINEQDGWGNTFIALSPNLLSDTHKFKEKMNEFIRRIKSSRTNDGKPLRVPGEKTLLTRDRVLSSGVVGVDDKLIKQLRTIASD